jgi:transcriptional regulator with XRE-family HTH domain
MAESQPMVYSRAVRYIRKRLKLSRQQMAARLSLSIDRMAAIENSEGHSYQSDADVDRAFQREFGIEVSQVVCVYIADPDKMDEPFRSLLVRQRERDRDGLEYLFRAAITESG